MASADVTSTSSTSFWPLLLRQLGTRGTLLTAAVVGTLINVYGQLLVPLVRDSGAIVDELSRSFSEAPWLSVVSIALGFVFPWFVSAYAGARARLETRTTESLALFPDLKPDPVFRARPDGVVVETGAQTRALFERYGIGRAQDLLGGDLWDRLVAAVDSEGVVREPHFTCFAATDQWYVATASAAPDGINVYLAAVPRSAHAHPSEGSASS